MSPEKALDLRAKVADYVRCNTDDEVHHAFLDLLDGKDTLPSETLTLRDQFAIAALSGLIATPKTDEHNLDDIVFAAYRYADVMLKARKPDDEE